MELWSYGVMELWSYGVMELWSYGVMELWPRIPRIFTKNTGIPGFEITSTVNINGVKLIYSAGFA
jgi:hypothetical protein